MVHDAYNILFSGIYRELNICGKALFKCRIMSMFCKMTILLNFLPKEKYIQRVSKEEKYAI